MKVQKIIALIAVLAVTVSILNIPVSALAIDESFEYVVAREIYNDITKLFEDHRNGDVTFSELISGLTTISINATATGFDYEANRINRLINGLQRSNGGAEHGGGGSGGSRSPISDIWDDICNKHNVPTETTQTSTTDMRGFGARLDLYSDGKLFTSKYGDYIVIQRFLLSNGTYSYTITLYPQRASQVYPNNKGWSVGYFESYVSNTGAGGLSESDLSNYKWYGDVRYVGFDEGTEPVPDDEFVYGTIHNFDDMDDKQISDLINEFSEELERQNPDLSSLEGLLNAIYARLGTLDSDNDNDLLNAINANILALIKADKDKDEKYEETNKELVNTLLEVRDSLKNGTLGTAPESHGHEISGTVYNVIPLDKNFLNKLLHDKTNLKVQYEDTVYYLEDCGCLKISDKYYTPNMNYNSYAFADYDFSNSNVEIDGDKYVNVDFSNYNTLIAGFSASQKKKIDNVVDLMYKMISQAVPYGVITSSFIPYESIIFNISDPQDIVLTFESTDTVGGFSATILSVSFFQNQYVAAAMNIVKPLITVIIGYCWLKVMRCKAVGMLRPANKSQEGKERIYK